MKINYIKPLKFDSDLEQVYKAYTNRMDQNYIRVALLLFIFLYAIFSITDYILVPQWFELFFVIRFLIVIPSFLITLLLSSSSNFYKWKQLLLTYNYIIGGIGISIMLVLEPENIIYYGGLFLVFTSGYFMLHLNTKNAIFAGFIILLSFIIGVIISNHVSLTVFLVTIFLLAENLIGSMGAYQLEGFKRNEFLNINSLNTEQMNLHGLVREKIDEVTLAQSSTISALAILAESRDKETGEHIERVGSLCYRLSTLLPLSYYESQEDKSEFCKTIQLASALHDIGKVGIADAILNKPGRLDKDEYRIMRTHSEIGSETLAKLYEKYPNNIFVKLGIEITHFHHERWDGKGYPVGISGMSIPLSARIMAIVDVYDALISKRPYKEPYSHDHAITIIKSEAGKHFDPDLVTYFAKIFED